MGSRQLSYEVIQNVNFSGSIKDRPGEGGGPLPLNCQGMRPDDGFHLVSFAGVVSKRGRPFSFENGRSCPLTSERLGKMT